MLQLSGVFERKTPIMFAYCIMRGVYIGRRVLSWRVEHSIYDMDTDAEYYSDDFAYERAKALWSSKRDGIINVMHSVCLTVRTFQHDHSLGLRISRGDSACGLLPDWAERVDGGIAFELAHGIIIARGIIVET